MPGVTATETTRDETLQAIRQVIVSTLATAESVHIDIPAQTTSQTNPWLATAGIFADDVTLEPMLEDIYIPPAPPSEPLSPLHYMLGADAGCPCCRSTPRPQYSTPRSNALVSMRCTSP